MFDVLVIGAFRIFWYCFGALIMFSIAFSLLAGKRADLWSALRLPLSIVAASVSTVCGCCAVLAEQLTARLPKPYAGLAAGILQVAMVLAFFYGVLWLAGHASV